MTDPIDELLVDAGMADDLELQGALHAFRREATSVRPLPSAELAALMTPARQRSSRARRGGAIAAIVVIGTLGVGATAAAASPDVRSAAQQVLQAVTGALLGTTGAGGPAHSGVPGATTSPSPHGSGAPHPGASQHPGPSDHPGRGATQAATPNPHASHGGSGGPGGSGRPTAKPTPEPTPGDPGNGHKP